MLTLRQLRYFDALADQRHFGRAAQQCHISQPALSMQIAELEKQLGVILVERRSPAIALTGEGAEIARQAKHILRAVSDLTDYGRHRGRVLVGQLRLGVIPSIGPYLLPGVKALVSVTSEEWVFSGPHKVNATSSWAPRILRPLLGATCLIYDALFNVPFSKLHGLWFDIFKDTPNEKYPPYDSKRGYDDSQRETARTLQINTLKALKDSGGFRVFDVANEAYRGMSNTFLDKAQDLGYKPFFRFLHMVALVYKSDVSSKFSVIIVHDPLCDTFMTSFDSWIPFHKVKAQAKKAMTAHLIQAIIRRLQTPSDDRTNFQTQSSSSIFGNFLFAYALRVYLLFNLHTHSSTATHFGKAMLCCPNIDLFLPSNHGLPRSKYGINKKTQSKARRGETPFTTDAQIRDKLFRLLAQTRPNSSDDDINNIYDQMIDLLYCSVDKEEDVNGDAADVNRRRWQNQGEILCRFKDEQLTARGGHIYDDLNKKLVTNNAEEVESNLQAGVDNANQPPAAPENNNAADLAQQVAAAMPANGFGFALLPPSPDA